MQDKFKALSQKQIKIVALTILIILVVGIIIYKNTPKQKAIGVSNTVIKSLKTHDGKDFGLTDISLIDKMGVNSPFTGLSIFDYKLKSISESYVNETYTTYKVSQSDSEFASDVHTEENIHFKIFADGQWTEDKVTDNKVTFTSAKYKVKQYYVTYDVNYSEIDGSKKERDITLITQEQTHNKNDFKVMDIQGIN